MYSELYFLLLLNFVNYVVYAQLLGTGAQPTRTCNTCGQAPPPPTTCNTCGGYPPPPPVYQPPPPVYQPPPPPTCNTCGGYPPPPPVYQPPPPVYQPPPSSPEWESWGPWSYCSVSCGDGMQTRQRVCDTQCGVCQCIGPSSQSQPCNTQPCGCSVCNNPPPPCSVCSILRATAAPNSYYNPYNNPGKRKRLAELLKL
uniref:Uncharacterized protein n=1 Tax=Acrobeloides nanus TaxID=290746 RepID=A0A914EK42_9BILA